MFRFTHFIIYNRLAIDARNNKMRPFAVASSICVYKILYWVCDVFGTVWLVKAYKI